MRMHRILYISIMLVILLSFNCPLAFCDGRMRVFNPEIQKWELQQMNEQLCVINYENDTQNMLLSIYLNDIKGEKASWIFPVPATPEKVNIDILKGFPIFKGKTVQDILNSRISRVCELMVSTQIYTLFFLSEQGRGLQGRHREALDVTVHQHLEKSGLITELITAENKDDLYIYLKDKGLDVSEEMKYALNDYIGKKYSFVASWISDINKFKKETYKQESRNYELSIFLSFPTLKMFFPLQLTSEYGDTRIPMTVYVLGYASPEIFESIKADTHVDYLYSDFYGVAPDLVKFFNGTKKMKNFFYTKIFINSVSSNLVQDLWLQKRAPMKIKFIGFLLKTVAIWGALLFILVSCLASLLAGILTFGYNLINRKKFALFGLWNCFSLIGIILAARYLRIDRKYTYLEERYVLPMSLTKRDIKNISAVLLFVLFFLFYLGDYAFPTFIGCVISVSPIFLLGFLMGRNTYLGRFIVLFSVIFLALTIGISIEMILLL